MLKVTAKFTEKIWDKEANAEIPFELAYAGEALAVSAQEKGFSIQQKFNGRTCGMFFNYNDLSKLTIDSETFEDFKDLDNIESKVAALMATKKLTILGERFEMFYNPTGSSQVNLSNDLDITYFFNNGAPIHLYIKLIKDYQIQMIESENAVVEIGKINNNGFYPLTIKGVEGNVLIKITTVYTGNQVVGSVVIGDRTYKTVTIGKQTWLAENLNFKFSGLEVGKDYDANKAQANYYNNDEETYGEKYGLLYNLTAMEYLQENKAELIPGWRIPTYDDWKELLAFACDKPVEEMIYGQTRQGRNTLRSTEAGWDTPSDGQPNNVTGFSAVPSGYFTRDSSNNRKFSDAGSSFIMITCTKDKYQFYMIPRLASSTVTYEQALLDSGIFGGSIRLIKDV